MNWWNPELSKLGESKCSGRVFPAPYVGGTRHDTLHAENKSYVTVGEKTLQLIYMWYKSAKAVLGLHDDNIISFKL